MGQVLGAFATIFTVIAAYFLYVGFTIDTTVSAEGATVANLQLMHIQAMNIGLGIGAAVIASIFAVGAAVVASRR